MKQRRFDIAGAHPDEVYRAVADVHTAVKEIGQQLGGTWFSQLPEANDKILLWLANRPLRHGDNLDADVQQHLAMGGRIMDGLEVVLPLGLSKSQAEMRGRCHELAGSMEKVLQKRLQEEHPAKAWRYVKVNATPVTVKQPGQKVLPVDKTVAAVKDILRSHFGSAWKAGIAQRTYHLWARNAEEHSEKTGMYPPMPEGARSWHAFMQRADHERLRSALKGEHWAHVDLNEGIDFAQVMNFRAPYQQRPRMRM